jgi:hypothetical protein
MISAHGTTGLAVDSVGNMYVADRNNHRIRKVSNGNVTTIGGNGSATYKNGTGTNSSFYYPEGIDVAADGTVYVADTYNHRIRKIDTQNNVTLLLGTGKQGYSEGGINDASFYRPSGVAVGDKGVLYVADTYNHKVRKIENGKSSLLAGSAYGHADGKGSTVRFGYPYGVDFHNGRVFVADRSNQRIRVVEASGATWTMAGQASAGWVDGDALTKARFSSPYGVLWTNFGVLVADSSNHRIRIINSVAKDCDDSDPCTADSCEKKTGKCLNVKIKGCCVPTLYHGAFESSSEAVDVTFLTCPAGFSHQVPSNCAPATGSFNSKGWQVWPGSPVSKAGKGTLYYGYPPGKTYAFGYMHAGVAITKAVKVPTGVKSSLSFSLYFDTTKSGLYDRLKVWLWLDGQRQYIGTNKNSTPSNGSIWYRGGANNTPKKWYDVVVDTTQYAGKKVQLEFYFNAAKVPAAGSGQGVFVDEVKFVRACPK